MMMRRSFTASAFRREEHHTEETYEDFQTRYLALFQSPQTDDLFEYTRLLNNMYSTDILPSVEVLTAALKCGRKLNSFAVTARVVEALREKLGDESIYKSYLEELKPVMEELGVPTPEELER
jgi:cytochrome c oxidase subunit 5a